MRILVATNLERASEPAERVAALLAEQFNAEITLLYVFYRPAAPIAAPYYPLGKSAEEMERIASEARRRDLEARAHELFGDEAQAVVVDSRHPAEAIVSQGRRDGSHLIVMGTHGHAGWKRLARPASVAERVAHEASCPVLVVPTEAGSALPEGSRVLAATDLAAQSERAPDTAALWAKHLHGTLSLLHAYLPAVAIEASYGDFTPSPVVSETFAEPGRKRLEALSARYGDCVEDAELAPTLRAGREICARAEEKHADLVVLGCRRRPEWKRALFGSVSDTVLRHAEAPVLLVPLAER